MKLLLTVALLVISLSASADFLIVQRTGNLRASPSTSAEVLEKLKTGDTLLLVSPDQVDGYYHVTALTSGQLGWVYRTLVRKVEGEVGVESLGANEVVDVRVLDVGAGLCNLIKLPGNKFVVYDAGGDATTNGNRTFDQIKEVIPLGSTIELLVLSHMDADHIVAAGQVIRNYEVKKVLWSGFERSMISTQPPTAAFNRLVSALNERPQTVSVNLHEADSVIAPGTQFNIGDARLTFLCGFGNPLPEWNLGDRAEQLNAVSIVMKLEFADNSILFCGDAVGRHRDDPEDALIATEAFLIQNAPDLLQSTVVIAPHHGAKNGSSEAFVDLVQPKAVVFSAGHNFLHPTTRTADQYLRFVTTDAIFRTDRGDDEGSGEWNFGRVVGCRDRFNDDTIQIQLRANKTFRVFYVDPPGPCSQ